MINPKETSVLELHKRPKRAFKPVNILNAISQEKA